MTQLPVIEERLRTLKEVTERRVDEAMGLVVSDETLAAVKTVRAELNRDFAAYEEQRKAVKAAIMAPYDRFEEVYRECVTAPFKRADADLKRKIDTTEQEIKGRCEEMLRSYFKELCAANGVDFLTFEQTGVRVDMASARAKTPKKLMEQLKAAVEGCAQAAATIREMEYGGEIFVEYKKCLDLTYAIRVVTERRRELDAQRQQAEAAAPRQADVPPEEEVETTPLPQRVRQAEVERLTLTFTVTDTRERLRLIKQFLVSNGYQFQ